MNVHWQLECGFEVPFGKQMKEGESGLEIKTELKSRGI